MKTSLFARNFMIYAIVIVLGFTVLGSSFIYQVNRFSGEETQQQLNDTAQQAWASTQAYFQLRDNADWNDKFNANYRVALNMLARDSGGTIFVGDSSSTVMVSRMNTRDSFKNSSAWAWEGTQTNSTPTGSLSASVTICPRM